MALKRLAYSIKETTQMLGISRSALYRHISAGKVSIRHVGGRTLITAAEVERILATPAEPGWRK